MEGSSSPTAAMEQPSFSSFKIQLLSFLSQFQDLREDERRAKEGIEIANQLRKQAEVELGEKIRELREELGACQESKRKLEGTVHYLQNDNAILDMKIQELKGTVESLLQSRDVFIKHYEDSTCELRHSIEAKDRKLCALSQMLQAHKKLFVSLEREALSLKQTLERTEHIVCEKEQVVTELIRKMDLVTSYEEQCKEKFVLLEKNLKTCQDELQRKNFIILELKEEIKDAKDHGNCIAQIEERNHIRRTESMKEVVIQNLIAEKQALRLEVEALEDNLQRILPYVIAAPEANVKYVGDDKDEGVKENCQGASEDVQNEIGQSTVDEPERSLLRSPQKKRGTFEASKYELVCFSPSSTCSEAAANVVDTSLAGNKGNTCTDFRHQLASDSSVTGDGISEGLSSLQVPGGENE